MHGSCAANHWLECIEARLPVALSEKINWMELCTTGVSIGLESVRAGIMGVMIAARIQPALSLGHHTMHVWRKGI